ncbi:hypothetical protein ABT214_01035 [Micromonospora purpureochromogenes]|uniref:hypothetical protein n=1 Tax=Micromonospora purpureochromogenes TaxID=47872 RepID=UPI00332B98A4
MLARVIRSTGRPGGGFGRIDPLLAGQTHQTDLDQGTSAASPAVDATCFPSTPLVRDND